MVNEMGRKLIEYALESGKMLKNESTGFLHFNPHDEKGHIQTIPVFENFLYVLSLIKARRVEALQESKLLLERLLSYQSDNEEQGKGNFPLYLHEFPFCYQRWQAVRLLAPLCSIVKNYHPSLGEELRKKLWRCLNRMAEYCIDLLKKDPADYLTTLRIAAGVLSIGRILKNYDLEAHGEQLLDDLLVIGIQPIWHSRFGIAEILTSLQMVYPKVSDSSWNQFWQHFGQTWHPLFHVYCGPAFDEWQKGSRAEPTLYDFFTSAYTQTLSPNIIEKNPSCLLASLIDVTGEVLHSEPIQELEGRIGSTVWFLRKSEHFAMSSITRQEKMDPQFRKGIRSFHLQWQNHEDLYSLSCEGGDYHECSCEMNHSEVTLNFTFPAPGKEEGAMEKQELTFYCSQLAKMKFHIAGETATTFKLGETLRCNSLPGISLSFTLKEGDASFLGHLMPGNRISQKLISKNHSSDAYDWQIFLRRIRVKSPFVIQVKIQLPH